MKSHLPRFGIFRPGLVMAWAKFPRMSSKRHLPAFKASGTIPYIAAMNRTAQNAHFDEPFDSKIERLLTRAEPVSIIDSVLALTDDRVVEDNGSEFDRAVYNRLQARLAERMRQAIGSDSRKERKSAA